MAIEQVPPSVDPEVEAMLAAAVDDEPPPGLNASEAASTGQFVSSLFQSIARSQARHHDREREAALRIEAFKRYSPLILGIIHRPGHDGPPAEKKQALRSLLGESMRISERVADAIAPGVERKGYYVDKIYTTVAEVVAASWAYGDHFAPGEIVDDLVSMIPEVSDIEALLGDTRWTPGGNLQGADIRAGLLVSLTKVSEPLLVTVRGFGEDDWKLRFGTLQDALLDHSIAFVDGVSHELPSATRLQLFQGHIEASARIMNGELVRRLGARLPFDAKDILAEWRRGIDTLQRTVNANVEVLSGVFIKPEVVQKEFAHAP